jgi:hypothetical protein
MLRYYGSHFGSEKELRQAQMHLTSLYSHLVFYPRSLWNQHLGTTYAFAASVILSAAGAWAVRRRNIRENTATTDGQADLRPVLAFTAASIVIPLALFTADASKSPVVAGVVVGPLSILIVMGAYTVLRTRGMPSRFTTIAATALGAVAIWHEFSAVSRHSRITMNRSDEQALLRTYADMLDYAHAAGWKKVYIANDRLTDYTLAHIYTILHYEHTHELYPVLVTFGGSVTTVPRDVALSGIAAANFAVLTRKAAQDAVTLYPFDKEMIAMEQELWTEAKKRMSLFRNVSYNGHEMAIYAKAAVRVEGASGDWLTADGASLVAPCKLLAGKKSLVAAGSTIFPEMISNGLGVRATLKSVAGTRPLATDVSPVTSKYSIKIDLRDANISPDGSCEISLAFDRYFVPKERGINADPRKLVIEAPTDFHLE